MTSLSSKPLLSGLQQQVRQTLLKTSELMELSDDLLHFHPKADAWSVAQVLAHLSSYNRYYLPQIVRCMNQNSDTPDDSFKTGFFGNYFTKMMEPPTDPDSFKKYKAPKDHTPPADLSSEQVLSEFKEGQERLSGLLQMAGHKNLEKIKVPVSISRFIRLRLGDTFRFLIAHQMRHFAQIDRILNQTIVLQ